MERESIKSLANSCHNSRSDHLADEVTDLQSNIYGLAGWSYTKRGYKCSHFSVIHYYLLL